jgi:hypothetical protein
MSIAKRGRRVPGNEWHEVQQHRYDKGFYPGSGKINPFFRKLGAPNRRFGIQLLAVGSVVALVPLFGLVDRSLYPFFLVFGAVLLIGGVGHVRSDSR